jgi:hypothetical protein
MNVSGLEIQNADAPQAEEVVPQVQETSNLPNGASVLRRSSLRDDSRECEKFFRKSACISRGH